MSDSKPCQIFDQTVHRYWLCNMYYLAITIIYLYTYNIYVRIYVLLPKPSLRPLFVNLFEKTPISRATSASIFPSPPRCPPIFLAKSCRSLTSAHRFSRDEYTLGARLYRERRCHRLFVFPILFSLFCFFFFLRRS